MEGENTLNYYLEKYIKERIKEARGTNADLRDVENEVIPAEESLKQLLSGNKNAKGSLLRYKDCKDQREIARNMFCVELGIEIAVKIFKNLGLI